MSTATDSELTETLVENFIATMKFIANNDLWDSGQRALEAAGIATISVSSEPIRVFRTLVTDDLLANDRLGPAQRRHALVIAECGCGMGSPGPPGHGAEFPRGGPGDAGPETTLATDGG
jgi:hypothetical protein